MTRLFKAAPWLAFTFTAVMFALCPSPVTVAALGIGMLVIAIDYRVAVIMDARDRADRKALLTLDTRFKELEDKIAAMSSEHAKSMDSVRAAVGVKRVTSSL